MSRFILRVNANGLTFKRWLAAAGRTKGSSATRDAWATGEDPTEWRASSAMLSSGRKVINLEALGRGLKNAVRRQKRKLNSKR